MKRFTLLFMILASLNVSARTIETTLWEETYVGGNIEISAAQLQTGATVTVFMNVTADTHLHVFYNKNNENNDQASFKTNGGTIEEWNWQNASTKAYSFTIDAADMAILNDNSEETGSTGILFVGSANASTLTITRITVSIEETDEVGSTSELWSGSCELGDWGNFESLRYNDKGELANAKVGDDIIVTFSHATEGCQIYVCDAGTYAEFDNGYFTPAANEESASIAFTITDANVLESIQEKGIVVKGKRATLTKIELVTYATSYDAVSVTISDAGIATFSSSKHLSFEGTGITPYYASEVNTGVVYLTSTTTTWSWQGYILRGDAGTYTIPVIEESQTYWPRTNYLKQCVNGSTVTASTPETYHYILAKDGENTPSFYKLGSNHTLGVKKAYLETTSDITPTGNEAKGLSIVFDDTTTDVSAFHTPMTNSNNNIFTVNGMTVSKPTRGMYIVNGHKVIVR